MGPGDVGHDPEQPRLEGGPPFEPVQAAERADPGLLHDFVGDRARADERPREPVHRRAVSVDESAERVLVSAAEGGEERGLAAQGFGAEHPLGRYTLAPA